MKLLQFVLILLFSMVLLQQVVECDMGLYNTLKLGDITSQLTKMERRLTEQDILLRKMEAILYRIEQKQ